MESAAPYVGFVSEDHASKYQIGDRTFRRHLLRGSGELIGSSQYGLLIDRSTELLNILDDRANPQSVAAEIPVLKGDRG